MQTNLPAELLATTDGARADAILRRCVHCGFCNATCPTYQILGDELDGPRGRIYLMKEMLETSRADDVTRLHLDRCLTCRACETTCPSGVEYGELLEIGRGMVESTLRRPLRERWLRAWLVRVLPDRRRLERWRALGRRVRWLMPARLRHLVGRRPGGVAAPAPVEAPTDSVIVLEGCVQRALTPEVNRHLAELLAARGVASRFVPSEACCGGLALHLGDVESAKTDMIRNLDALADHDARIVSTASGCGVTLKDYGRLFADDPARAVRAAELAARVVDVSELLRDLHFDKRPDVDRVAWQPPCTLQHGQKIVGVVEGILKAAGYELVPVRNAHLCCGSAGTYSLLQPDLANTLKSDKLESLLAGSPDVIATANVGCQTHLASGTGVAVVHWLELLR